MYLTKSQLDKIANAIKIHTDWLVVALLGHKAVSKEDLEAMKIHGLNIPLDSSIISNTFVLGRLRAVLTKGEWLGLTYEELLEEAQRTHTDLEELAIQEAELSAAVHVKNIANDIANHVFDSLAAATNEVITEATVKDIIKDKVKLALIERKSYQKLAADLANTIPDGFRRDWRRLAETELQTVKTKGQAHAILNMVGIYSDEGGPDASVSVVPAPGCCEDCNHHYLNSDGNPKIFKLKDLIANGSNGDAGVSHKKQGNLHVNWKTTLPALHPRCGCNLTFVPNGYKWIDGKLSREIKKADDREYTPFSPKAAPMGPETAVAKPKKPANLPGIASPEKLTAVQKPSAGKLPKPGAEPTSAMNVQSACPLGGGEACIAAGGDGAMTHKQGGKIMEAHAKHQASVGGPSQPEVPAQNKPQISDSDWKSLQKPKSVVRDHLKNGEFVESEDMNPEGKTFSSVFKVKIDGNGSAAWKPHTTPLDENDARPGVVPPFSYHNHEVCMSNLNDLFGLDVIPPTELRSEDGEVGSAQAWIADGSDYQDLEMIPDDFEGKDKKINYAKMHIDKNPELQESMSDMILLDIVSNNTDRHRENVKLSVDADGKKSMKGIDHGLCYGNGLNGYRNHIHRDMHTAGLHVKPSQQARDRLKNLTYGDIQRTHSDLQPWQQAQTYLRAKYAEHLLNTDGHLDYNKFVHVLEFPNGQLGMDSDDISRYNKIKKEGGRSPHESFSSFARDWLYEKASSGGEDSKIADLLLDTRPFRNHQEVMGRPQFTSESKTDNDLQFGKTPVARRRS